MFCGFGKPTDWVSLYALYSTLPSVFGDVVSRCNSKPKRLLLITFSRHKIHRILQLVQLRMPG